MLLLLLIIEISDSKNGAVGVVDGPETVLFALSSQPSVPEKALMVLLS